MYADELLAPWLHHLLTRFPDARLFDVHNHVGDRDPSGFTATVEELIGSLVLAGGRSVVMPAAEPEGYDQPNKACATASASSGGALTAFTRVTPRERPADLLTEGLASGARGVKLHGASDEFDLEDPRLEEVYRIADAERLPMLVHAGPELEGVGAAALRICHRYPGLRLILAHCALTDVGWIWREVSATPNLYFDTSWWTPAHLMALFRLVPPGRVLMASDLPYATPLSGALATVRCAWQAGLTEEQVCSVAGGQLERLVAGDEPLADGTPPVEERRRPGVLLEVLSSNLLIALEPMQRGEQPESPLTVARRACDVAQGDPDADVVGSVARLIRLYDEHHERLPQRNQFTPGWDLIAAAGIVARTPAATFTDGDGTPW
jgi:uncharacterized protein